MDFTLRPNPFTLVSPKFNPIISTTYTNTLFRISYSSHVMSNLTDPPVTEDYSSSVDSVASVLDSVLLL